MKPALQKNTILEQLRSVIKQYNTNSEYNCERLGLFLLIQKFIYESVNAIYVKKFYIQEKEFKYFIFLS